jgi:hypothetical protein
MVYPETEKLVRDDAPADPVPIQAGVPVKWHTGIAVTHPGGLHAAVHDARLRLAEDDEAKTHKLTWHVGAKMIDYSAPSKSVPMIHMAECEEDLKGRHVAEGETCIIQESGKLMVYTGGTWLETETMGNQISAEVAEREAFRARLREEERLVREEEERERQEQMRKDQEALEEHFELHENFGAFG